MSPDEVLAHLRKRRWSVAALADRWGYSRRHVTAKIADRDRGVLWDDAFLGLPEGPGLYRQLPRRSPLDDAEASALVLGSLVASEADFDSFGFGSRGVVVEIRAKNRWLVVWDGGQEMEIDTDCLSDWVVDLGLVSPMSEGWSGHNCETRIQLARNIDLYG